MSASSTVLTEVGANLTQPSVDEQKLYNRLVLRAKHLAYDGYLPEALSLYRRALAIYPAPSLQRKISRIEAHLSEQDGKVEPLPDSSVPCSGQSPHASPRSSALPANRGAADEQNANGKRPDCGDRGATSGYGAYSSPAATADGSSVSLGTSARNGARTVSASTTDARCSVVETSAAAVSVGDDDNHDDSRRRQHYTKLIADAREAIEQRDLERALSLYKQAQSIRPAEKIARRIERIENYMEEAATNDQEAEDEPQRGSAHARQEEVVETKMEAREGNEAEEQDGNGDMVLLGNGFYLYGELISKLYRHQKEGVLWLWSLYKQRKGGILADDMGLGKTVQVISFLSGLFDSEDCQKILIVMPVSLIVNWQKEFEEWAPGIPVYTYHGQSQRERERILLRVQRRGGVMLTSYGIVVSNWETLAERNGKPLVWDCVILDEGHKIKNPTKTSKGVHGISARCRIVMTGTPVQNNLSEMWALFDFTHHGMLLGSRKTFKEQYENPITRAREKCATRNEKVLGQEMAESLRRIISPYFLRRTKAEIKAPSSVETVDGGQTAEMPALTKKNDLIVWLYLSDIQKQIYQDFLSLDSIKELLMSTKSPLTALTVLKKLCDHPRLLSIKACCELGLDGVEMASGLDQLAQQSAATQIHSVKDEVLVAESGKMVFLVQLLDRLRAEGHRTLVFSQSRKMLDIIEKVMVRRGYKIIRLDGSIKDLHERDQRVQKFQENRAYNVFLLTTQVGGIGLTLTAASRVVIFDPSWNPATDSQAVDRAFRIGQRQNVIIYRFITCGTVEEKIYRRQVFKDSITMQTTGASKNPMRYFTRLELRDLFQLDCTDASETQQQLERMHSAKRVTDSTLDEHIAYLRSCAMFGISDHDLMFTVEEIDEEQADVLQPDDVYVQKRVEKAQELLSAEAELQGRMNAATGKYVPQQFSTKQKTRGGEKKEKGSNEDEPLASDYIGESQLIEQLGKRVADIQLDEASSIGQEDGNHSDCVVAAHHDESEGEAVAIDDDDDGLGIDDSRPSDLYCQDASIQDVTVATDVSAAAASGVGLPTDGSPSRTSCVGTSSFHDQIVSVYDDVSKPASRAEHDVLAAEDSYSSPDLRHISASLQRSPIDKLYAADEAVATDFGQREEAATCFSPTSATTCLSIAEPIASRSDSRSQSQRDSFVLEQPVSPCYRMHSEVTEGVGKEASLDEMLEKPLPYVDFTQDTTSPGDDNSKRKKLNRRSSYLPALSRMHQSVDFAERDAGDDCSSSDDEDDDVMMPRFPSRKQKNVALASDDEDDCTYEQATTVSPLGRKQLASNSPTPTAEDQQSVCDDDAHSSRRISSRNADSLECHGHGATRQPRIGSDENEREFSNESCQDLLPLASHQSFTDGVAFEPSHRLPANNVIGSRTSVTGHGAVNDASVTDVSEGAVANEQWESAKADEEKEQKAVIDEDEGEVLTLTYLEDEEKDGHEDEAVEEKEGAQGEEAMSDGTDSEEADEDGSETDSQEEEDCDGAESDDLSTEFDSSDEESYSESEESQQRHHLRKQSKQYYRAGDYRNSLKCLLKSLHRGSSERLQVLAMRLKYKISN